MVAMDEVGEHSTRTILQKHGVYVYYKQWEPELHVLSFVKTQYTCMTIALVSNNTRTDENNNRLCVCISEEPYVLLAETQVFCSKRRIHTCIIAKRPLKNTSI